MDLSGKHAIVTGSGQGIGRAIALAYARAGASLVIADRNREAAEQVAAEVRGHGQRALAVQTDVASEESVAAMVDAALREFGSVDVLVANAGIQRRYFVQDLPRDEFQAMLDVNLIGPYICAKAVLPTMYERRDGAIIMIISNSARVGYAFNSAYCASKFGLLGFMEALADECKSHGVRVNGICPGGVKTAMIDDLRQSNGKPYDVTNWTEPEEIADVALFLATPPSRAIHGQALNVYGGVKGRTDAP